MKTFSVVLLLVAAAPALAQSNNSAARATTTSRRAVEQKPVYRTLDRMLKDFSRAAQSKLVAAR